MLFITPEIYYSATVTYQPIIFSLYKQVIFLFFTVHATEEDN